VYQSKRFTSKLSQLTRDREKRTLWLCIIVSKEGSPRSSNIFV